MNRTSLQWLLLLTCTFGYMGENLNCRVGDEYCDHNAILHHSLFQFQSRDCGANFSREVRNAKEDKKSFSAFGVPISEIKDLSYFLRTSFEVFGCELPGVQLDAAGLIRLPDTITRIKIDVGLSHSAPNTQMWLEKIPGLVVFGFEPNLQAVSDMLSNRVRPSTANTKHLDRKYVGSQMFLFPVALGSSRRHVDFHATKDPACSSLMEPDLEKMEDYGVPDCGVADVYPVAVVTLSDLLSKIPWGTAGDAGVFQIVEHIKTDAQGHDVEVLRGAGPYLSQRVVCVTSEKFAWGYKEPGHNAQELVDFMWQHGFALLNAENEINSVMDLTFYNTKFQDWLQEVDCSGGDDYYTGARAVLTAAQ